MNFLHLPEDIIILVLRKLDQVSLLNMYNTCHQLRNMVSRYGGLKILKLSMNSLATANTLKSSFFRNMAHNLKELDLSGMPNLTKSLLVPSMKKLKFLTKLNVSFTNICLLDILPIYNACPTIRDIKINFVFPRSFFLFESLSAAEGMFAELKDVFKNFEHVHFVGSNTDVLVATNFPVKVLEKATLKSLKFSLCWVDFYYSINNQVPVADWRSFNAERFDIFVLNWKDPANMYDYDVTHCSLLDHIEGHEFIVISMLKFNTYTVYTTPVFESLFKDTLKVTANVLTQLAEGRVFGNIAIMCWKKGFNFNQLYLTNLAKDLQAFFPQSIDDTNTLVHSDQDWFYSTSLPQNNLQEVEESPFKKRRVAVPSHYLNYDTIFREKATVKLSLSFDISHYVTLMPSFQYLKKLTYLSLSGQVRYNLEFFNILFRCCNNLETLNIEASKFSPCAFPISRSMPLSRSIKNLRLLDKCIDFSTLFSAFSQCCHLENVQITDESTNLSEIANPILVFEKCNNLYCFSISAAMSGSVRTKRLKQFNKIKASCKKTFLHVELLSNIKARPRVDRLILYDPFVSVFNVHSIKPL